MRSSAPSSTVTSASSPCALAGRKRNATSAPINAAAAATTTVLSSACTNAALDASTRAARADSGSFVATNDAPPMLSLTAAAASGDAFSSTLNPGFAVMVEA